MQDIVRQCKTRTARESVLGQLVHHATKEMNRATSPSFTVDNLETTNDTFTGTRNTSVKGGFQGSYPRVHSSVHHQGKPGDAQCRHQCVGVLAGFNEQQRLPFLESDSIDQEAN